MFEVFLGIPTHALAVHLPVVLVPLLVLVALAYALVPPLRSHLGWAAVTLAVVAPVSAVVAKLSGDAYRELLYGPQQLGSPELQTHAELGDLTMWSSIGLGAVTLVLAAVRRGTERGCGLWKWVAWLLSALLVVAAAIATYYLIRVGHSGSDMVHGGRVPG